MAFVMTHDRLMAAIRREAHQLGLMVHHCHVALDVDPDTGEQWDPGFPDLLIAGPGGQLFAEVKSVRGRLEDGQWSWAGMLLLGGAVYVTWRPVDWPETIKEQLGRLAKV